MFSTIELSIVVCDSNSLRKCYFNHIFLIKSRFQPTNSKTRLPNFEHTQKNKTHFIS